MTDLQMWDLIWGFIAANFVLPILQQPKWSKQTRAAVAFGFCLVSGLVIAALNGAYDGVHDVRSGMSSVLLMLVSTIASYQGVRQADRAGAQDRGRHLFAVTTAGGGLTALHCVLKKMVSAAPDPVRPRPFFVSSISIFQGRKSVPKSHHNIRIFSTAPITPAAMAPRIIPTHIPTVISLRQPGRER